MAVLGEFLVRCCSRCCFSKHRTKNSPKTATNCAEITNRTQIQPHVKVSEVYFFIHKFVLVFSRTKVNFAPPVAGCNGRLTCKVWHFHTK